MDEKQFIMKIVILVLLVISLASATPLSISDIPAAANNKVAYYVFDSGGPDHFPLTSFTDEANIVVLFEGKLWELADSVHYSTGWMRNVNYHYYSEIMRDVRILQSRGVKVLMNVDDAASWSTSTPFTAYDGVKYNYQQFAEFIKTCAIDSLHLDGISLDIEHKAQANDYYKSLLKEIGKYFGPMSVNSDSQMYIAAMYNGYWGQPGFEIGRSKDIMNHLNFVMDMAYFDSNYTKRFNQWADSIGSNKVMIGVLIDNNDLDFASKVAAWQPSSGAKAGIMVYAANNLKSYTDSVFKSLVVPITDVKDYANNIEEEPNDFILLQNYPNPFNPSTKISFALPQTGYVTLKIYDLLGREIKTLLEKEMAKGNYSTNFVGSNYASGLYFARLIVQSNDTKSYIKTIKMLLSK